MEGFRIIGHRGWGPTHNYDVGALYPENTMIAFQHALEQGADGIELDVLLSKDGIPVVIHDRHLSRHVIPEQAKDVNNRPVSDFTVEELKCFDLGKGQTIPTLEELFIFARKKYPKTIINLDVKDANLVLPVLEEIRKYSAGYTDHNIIISSYDWDLLRLFRKQDKNIALVPAIKSVLLFGPENVRAEDYMPLTETYDLKARTALIDLHDEIRCLAFDCSVTDLKSQLIEWAAECGVGLQISTSNTRVTAEQTNYEILATLKKAERELLPFVICKVDEPGPVKRKLSERLRSQGNPHSVRHLTYLL